MAVLLSDCKKCVCDIQPCRIEKSSIVDPIGTGKNSGLGQTPRGSGGTVARTGPKHGLSPPNRTLPESATLPGVARISMVFFSSCFCIVLSISDATSGVVFDATLCKEKASIVSGYCMTARPLAHEHRQGFVK